MWTGSFTDRCFVSFSWSLLIFPTDFLLFQQLLKNYVFSLQPFSLMFAIYMNGKNSGSIFFPWTVFSVDVKILSSWLLQLYVLKSDRVSIYSSYPNFESSRVVSISMGTWIENSQILRWKTKRKALLTFWVENELNQCFNFGIVDIFTTQ